MADTPLPRRTIQAAYYHRLAKVEAVVGMLLERVETLERHLSVPDREILNRGRPSLLNLLPLEPPDQVARRRERLKKRRQRARIAERKAP